MSSGFSDKASNYLIRTPEVEGEGRDTEEESWPGDVPRDGITENVESIRAREVALWLGSPVAITDDTGDGIKVLIQQLLVSSHCNKG